MGGLQLHYLFLVLLSQGLHRDSQALYLFCTVQLVPLHVLNYFFLLF